MSGRESHHLKLSKWKLVLPFWVVQVLTLYLFIPAWFMSAGLVDAGRNMGSVPWSDYLAALVERELFVWWLVSITVLTLLQAIFLWPIRRPAAKQARGWPIFRSLAVAGLAIALLSGGFLWMIADTTEVLYLRPRKLSLKSVIPGNSFGPILIGWCLLNWLIATPLLIRFCRRGPRESLLSRVASRLFLGTIIEAAAIIPLDIMVRRKHSCYCGAGTFWALTVCASVGFIVAGPAILLPLVAKRRKRWYEGKCDVCAYDMTGCPNSLQCPECGAGWRPAPSE